MAPIRAGAARRAVGSRPVVIVVDDEPVIANIFAAILSRSY
jgi:hypothetical protein